MRAAAPPRTCRRRAPRERCMWQLRGRPLSPTARLPRCRTVRPCVGAICRSWFCVLFKIYRPAGSVVDGRGLHQVCVQGGSAGTGWLHKGGGQVPAATAAGRLAVRKQAGGARRRSGAAGLYVLQAASPATPLHPCDHLLIRCWPHTLQVSFAADNNFGDISAKATSQTIFSSVLGTAVGARPAVLRLLQLNWAVGLPVRRGGRPTRCDALHPPCFYHKCFTLASAGWPVTRPPAFSLGRLSHVLSPPLPCPSPPGVTLASQIGQSVGLALTAYSGLAALHMWTGYQAVR